MDLNHVIPFQEIFFAYRLILDDLKKSNRCDFTVAKKPDDNLMMLVFPTAKNSPYTEQFSRGYWYLKKTDILCAIYCQNDFIPKDYDFGIGRIDRLVEQAQLPTTGSMPQLDSAKKNISTDIERTQWGFSSPGSRICLGICRVRYRTFDAMAKRRGKQNAVMISIEFF